MRWKIEIVCIDKSGHFKIWIRIQVSFSHMNFFLKFITCLSFYVHIYISQTFLSFSYISPFWRKGKKTSSPDYRQNLFWSIITHDIPVCYITILGWWSIYDIWYCYLIPWFSLLLIFIYHKPFPIPWFELFILLWILDFGWLFFQ